MPKTLTASEPYLELLKDCLTASLYEESGWKVVEPIPRERHGFLRRSIQRTLISALRKRGFLLVQANRYNPEARLVGGDWPMFGYTMAGRKRLDNIESCIRDVVDRAVPGDFIETGVWRGGSCIFAKALLDSLGERRTVWLADSFEGMPRPKTANDGWDLSGVGQLSVSVEQVRDNFRRFGLLDERIRFLKGWFSETLPNAPIDRLAILRLDGDLYHSTMDALNALYHRVSRGGYVIVDDYGGWEGCRRAVHEFLEREHIQVNIQSTGTECVFWRVE